MGKGTKRKRQFIIRHKLHKKEKILKLKTKYQNADLKERERIIAKIRKISTTTPVDEGSKSR